MHCIAWPLLAALTVATPSVAVAQTAVDIHGDVLELAISTTATRPEQPTLGGEARLSAKLATLQTNLRLGVEAGSNINQEHALWSSWSPTARSAWWNSGGAGLGLTWTPTPNVKLELKGSNQLRSELVLGDPILSGSLDQRLRSHRGSAQASVSVSPLAPLTLEMGGEANDQVRMAATETHAGPGAWDVLETDTRRLFTTLKWRVIRALTLEGGGRAETLTVAWSGVGQHGDAFHSVNPRFTGALTPWTDTTLRFGAERTVSPLKTDQFIRFAQAATPGVSAAFGPDQEWRYQAALEQTLAGDVQFKATLTAARIQAVTDLGPLGLAQAPIDIGAGERSQMEASLAAPMAVFGLPGLTIRARTAWRRSRVEDPFTGTPRPLSGEAAYEAELVLRPTDNDGLVDWGLTGRAAGPTTFYQMSRVTARSVSAGLGGFVSYNPGELNLRLQLDNVIGGGRTDRDLFYSGARRLNLERVEERQTADRAIRFVLSRNL
jgi:hypothetical protein